ncbi:DUF5691 domain-containing protein [Streptomyces sp. b94]|uniref:DUF5691 domain-containing protein n=1 Tax=Streptomyces sp. b94 TaxID=1827634 RepID=UPI000BF1B7DC|nr:hypothetical protein [Streptomyces sp. b94]
MTTAPTTADPFTNVTATGTSTATATGSGSAHSGPGPAPDRGPGSASAPGSPSVSGPASGFDAVAGLSWEELVTSALLGTDRRPPAPRGGPAPADAPAAVLDAAALHTVRQRAGLRPAVPVSYTHL